MTPITIHLTVLEVAFIVVVQFTTIACFAIWMDSRRRNGMAEAEMNASSRIAALKNQLDEERKERREEARTSQVRIDFLMDLLRDKTGSSGQTSAPEIDVFRNLSDHFSLEELEAMSLEAGLDWQNVEGDTLDAKAANMVKAAKRRGTLQLLAALIKRERPGGLAPQ